MGKKLISGKTLKEDQHVSASDFWGPLGRGMKEPKCSIADSALFLILISLFWTQKTVHNTISTYKTLNAFDSFNSVEHS